MQRNNNEFVAKIFNSHILRHNLTNYHAYIIGVRKSNAHA
jgi:hypothetical protein